MGLWANAPIMMAPGMGLNAFFAFALVLGQGVPWQEALGVVFISGVFFLILTFLGVREKIVKAIPASLRIATSVGIGLFIAFIGMQGLGEEDAERDGDGDRGPDPAGEVEEQELDLCPLTVLCDEHGGDRGDQNRQDQEHAWPVPPAGTWLFVEFLDVAHAASMPDNS